MTPIAATATLSSGKAMWYLTRSSGAVALVLLTAVVVLGALQPLRVSTRRWPRFAVATVHRDVSLLAIVFLAVHIASTVLDGFAPIGWLDALLPFRSAYRPLWLGLGALALDLLLALIATSLIRVRLGHRRWRRIHWLAYACWPVAMLHGLGTGSDATHAWMLALTAACTAAVVLAALARIRASDGSSRGRWLVLTCVAPAVVAGFLMLGPLQPNWARRAGTPARLIAGSARPPGIAGAAIEPAGRPAVAAFSAALSGRLRTTALPGGALIDLTLALRGRPGAVLRIRMAGRPEHSGGVALTGSQVDLLPGEGGAVMAGALTSLAGTRMTAEVLGSDGARLHLSVELVVEPHTSQVSGRVTASPTV